MTDLYQRSIALILEHQSSSGAYPASPTFPSYQYCWFRDGSFIAHAMDLAGQHESARRFFDWAAATVNARASVVEALAAYDVAGEAPVEILRTRYTLEGKDADSEWPNFQLDGFGTLLWAMNRHLANTGKSLPESWATSVRLLVKYLSTLWQTPCFDCWEEFPDQVHSHTLAGIRAGLVAAQNMLGQDLQADADQISDFLIDEATREGHFVKYVGSNQVDASLLGFAVPYCFLPLDDPLIRVTVAKIESDLVLGGGVHRYNGDTYYGGGEWVLLTAWLGWVYAVAGERDRALETKAWVEGQADEEGKLPEQVPVNLNDPDMFQPWVDRWGSIARPLLWSHAKYLILCHSLNE